MPEDAIPTENPPAPTSSSPLAAIGSFGMALAGGVGSTVKAPLTLAVGVVTAGPRALAAVDGMIRDVHSMAESVRVLPAVVDELNAIHDRTNNLDDEVMQMRASVNEISDEVVKLARIGDSLEEVTDVLHPLRTAGDRIKGIRGRRPPGRA